MSILGLLLDAMPAVGRGGSLLAASVPYKKALGGAIAGYGVHSAAQSQMFEQYYKGVYGDNDQTRESIDAIHTIGAVVGTALGIGGVFAQLRGNKLAKYHRKVNSSSSRFIGPPTGESIAFIGPKHPMGGMGTPRPLKQILKQRADGNWIRRHPFVGTFGISLGVGLAASYSLDRRTNMGEGRITAINSSPVGGIAPALQFSTQGLVQSLHKIRGRG